MYTPTGQAERLHLDELPQVFNILAGQMSVVGPRPERPEIAKEYEESIPAKRKNSLLYGPKIPICA